MCLRDREDYYGVVTRSLHWTIALLIIGMLVLGEYMEDLPDAPGKFQLYGIHKSLGIIILALVALRILWRLTNPLPKMPLHMKKKDVILARIAHLALYALMVLTPLSGWMMSSSAGFHTSVFGWFVMPDLLSKDEFMKGVLGKTHEFLAYAMMVLVSLHVAAALLHHFYHRDNVLRRMLPGKRDRADKS